MTSLQPMPRPQLTIEPAYQRSGRGESQARMAQYRVRRKNSPISDSQR